MRISWSRHDSSSDPRQPTLYLLASCIERKIDGGKIREVRGPAPEGLVGNPDVVQASINALPFEATYRCAVLSFAASDIDVNCFNAGVGEDRTHALAAMQYVIDTAFPGIPDHRRPPILACTHTHLGRLEINLLIPRFVRKADGSVRSYNPAPPRSSGGRIWPAAEAVLNKRFGWTDPRTMGDRTMVSGPDWLERQHRAALRAGREITRDQARLYLLDSAKNLAGRIRSKSPLNFAMNLIPTLMEIGYRLARISPGRLHLIGPLDEGGFTLSGGALGRSQLASHRTTPEPFPQRKYKELWHRVASANAATFDFVGRSEQPLEIDDVIAGLPLSLPTHHPEWPSPPGPHQSARPVVRDRLTDIITKVALALTKAQAAGLAARALFPFRKSFADLRTKLETTLYEQDCPVPPPTSGPLDDGADRAPDPRAGQSQRPGRRDESTTLGGRDFGHPDYHGSARHGDGRTHSSSADSRTTLGSAARFDGLDGTNERGSLLDPRPARWVDLIRQARLISKATSPTEQIGISLARHDGVFAMLIGGVGWQIWLLNGAISSEGAAPSELVDALHEGLTLTSIDPEEPVGPDCGDVVSGPQ